MNVEINFKRSEKSPRKNEKWPFIVIDEPTKQQKRRQNFIYNEYQ